MAFWSRITKSPDGCWLLPTYRGCNGYAKVSRGGHHGVLAHRVAWELVNGPIPPGMNVLHRCDIRNCVNPDHLFLGSLSDNTRDAVRKGRWPVRAITVSRLDHAAIVADRANGLLQRVIAERHGVHPSMISRVLSGKRGPQRHV